MKSLARPTIRDEAKQDPVRAAYLLGRGRVADIDDPGVARRVVDRELAAPDHVVERRLERRRRIQFTRPPRRAVPRGPSVSRARARTPRRARAGAKKAASGGSDPPPSVDGIPRDIALTAQGGAS